MLICFDCLIEVFSGQDYFSPCLGSVWHNESSLLIGQRTLWVTDDHSPAGESYSMATN